MGNFELIVDALDKASYLYPDVYSNAKSASDRFPHGLANKEVVKGVSTHRMKKRKQKHAIA